MSDYKEDLDRIARAVYPNESEPFAYFVDFIIEEIEASRRWKEDSGNYQALLDDAVEMRKLHIEAEARIKTLEDALRKITTKRHHGCGVFSDIAKQALAAKKSKA